MMGFCVSVFVLDLFHEMMWFHLKVQAVYLLVKFLINLLSYQMFLQSSLTPQANSAAVCRTSCSLQRNLTCLFAYDEFGLSSFPDKFTTRRLFTHKSRSWSLKSESSLWTQFNQQTKNWNGCRRVLGPCRPRSRQVEEKAQGHKLKSTTVFRSSNNRNSAYLGSRWSDSPWRL